MWPFKPNVEKLSTQKDICGLVKALKHRDALIAKKALEALKNFTGQECADLIVPLLRHARREVRLQANFLLALYKDSSAVEPILVAVQCETDEYVKARMIETLGELGDIRVAEKLLSLLESDKGMVRFETLIALGRLGDRRVVDPIIAMLREVKDVPLQASRLIKALGEIGDATAVEILTGVLGLGSQAFTDQSNYSCVSAARDALEKILKKENCRVKRSILSMLSVTEKVAARGELYCTRSDARGTLWLQQ